MTLSIVFAGTPDFSEHILQKLVDTQHTIVGVYSQPDRKMGWYHHYTDRYYSVLAEPFRK